MNKNDKIRQIVERYPDFWKTESAFMSYLRSGIRSGLWNKNKVKLLKIKNNRVQIPNPNPKGNKSTVWGGECEVCRKLFPTKDLQVDHLRENSSSLKCFDDVSQFISDMVLITEDDLRVVCKPCHYIISYSQKMNISFEEAKLRKKVINICKDKKLLVDTLVSLQVESIPKTKKGQEDLLYKLLLESKNE